MSENTNNEKKESLLGDDIQDIEESVEDIEDSVEDVEESKEDKISEKIENIKIEEAKPQPQAIVTPEPALEKPGLAYVAGGVLGSTKVAKQEPKPVVKKAEKKEDTVAVYSSRNVTWSGIGKVYIGYNIVSKEASEKWLTRDHTRLATPEEVAQEFGK
jgi:hypothetical protein